MAPRAGSSRGSFGGGGGGGGRKLKDTSGAAAHIQARQQRRQANGGTASSTGPKSIHDVFEYASEQADRADKAKGKGAQRRLQRAVRNDADRLNGATRSHEGDEDVAEGSDNDGQLRNYNTAPIFDDDESDGQVRAIASDDDEEIDSDEAFDESDEERYADWKFASDRKREGTGRGTTKRAGRVEDGDEDADGDGDSEDSSEDEDSDEDAGLVDLSKLLDGDTDADGSGSDEDEDEESDSEADNESEGAEKLQRHMNAMLASNSKRSADDASLTPSNVHNKRRVLHDRTEAIPEGEWNAPVRSHGSGLTLDDLMKPITEQAGTSLTTLRNNTDALRSTDEASGTRSKDRKEAVASKKGGGVLSVPLPTVVQDRMDRSAAYEDTKAEVENWQPTIKRIREAEHLSFPLQPEPVMRPSTAALTASFTPSNAFEDDVAALLEREGMTDKQLSRAEELRMNERGMSADEIRQRTAELRRTRDLLFREEQKAKRVSKIKSKTYRRIARKQKQREMEKAREAGAGNEDKDADDVRAKADRDRAQERATLKHKNAGKWAKNILGVKGMQGMPEARLAVNEQLARGEQLRRRAKEEAKDDEDHSDDEYQNKDVAEEYDDEDDDEGSSSDGSVVARIEPMLISRHAPTAMQQRELVAEAFAGDDVMTDFAAEKAALIEADAPQSIDTFLPGWGAWAGKGVRAASKKQTDERKKRFTKTTNGLDPRKRKDAGMAHVIINQKRDKKADKYKSNDVPYPYTSRAQYEMAMRNPLGPEWNTRTQHQRLTLPRVVSKPGKIIRPIEKMF